MPVDCGNPTNAFGQTAADPCRGPIDCLRGDYNAWLDVVKEEAELLVLARKRLQAEVLTEQLKADDPERAKAVAKLIAKMVTFSTTAKLTKPMGPLTVTDVTPEVLKIRDRAVEGCGLLLQARNQLRKSGADVKDREHFGKLDVWEESRAKAPVGWGQIAKVGGIALAAVAVLGTLGYAATAIARAQTAGTGRRRG